MNAMTMSASPALVQDNADAAMTVSELMTEIHRLTAAIGPAAVVTVTVTRRYALNNALITIFPGGFDVSVKCQHFDGPTFPAVFARAHEWAETYTRERSDSLVRRMAMAIIDLTDAFGEATDEALAERDFGNHEVAEFHEHACERAASMAGNRRFAVRFL